MNLKLTLSKYENFFSIMINLTIVIFIGIAIVLFKNLGDFSIGKVLLAFVYCFGGLLVMSIAFILPTDIIRANKDKKMCDDISIEYDDKFLMLEKAQKKALRERYKIWIESESSQEVNDWLNFD